MPPQQPSYGDGKGSFHDRIRFDRHEFAGSFGDLGTDLPLIVGMTLAADLDPASVLTMFGLFQVVTGLLYGLPMPMQPLKAMAALVIAGQATAGQLHGAGLAIGATMLILAATGGLSRLAALIPKAVVRGIQMGLGLTLADIALRRYLPDAAFADRVWNSTVAASLFGEAPGWIGLKLLPGFLLAAAGFALLLFGRLRGRWWAGPAVVGLGLLVTSFIADWEFVAGGVSLTFPEPRIPTWSDIGIGFLVLALPQIPLSLSNSVIATSQTAADLYPERNVTVRKIGLTYGLANLVAPWFSGIPVCHGCGGLAGHYALGARTGGSVVIYGCAYLVTGLLLAESFAHLAGAFPLPLLGVLLAFEALVLLGLVRELAGSSRDWLIAGVVALCAFGLPQGYLIGVVTGLVLNGLLPRNAVT